MSREKPAVSQPARSAVQISRGLYKYIYVPSFETADSFFLVPALVALIVADGILGGYVYSFVKVT
ncbi:hypothetical protein SDJN02_10330, partial [Cucurbita argyrosperma subsp. argyrosperma]